MGGPAALTDTVLTQVADTTGLDVVAPNPPPTSGIVRAAGDDRFQTAAAAAALLGTYDPAYLPTDTKAADADLLDGKDSTAFQPAGDYLGPTDTAADADTLDGKDSAAFQPAGDYALAGQQCAAGDVVSGITAAGQVACSTDAVDGGDATTLNGKPAAAFAPASLDAFVPVATFIISPTGTVMKSQWRGPLTGPPTAEEAAPGFYLIDLPGLSLSYSDNTAVCTRAVTEGTIHHEVVAGDLAVAITDVDGASEASSFHCIVFDG